ncbi:MAG TPA: TylF/MycF/NovP-related O-methyltransferase [Candidatus Xenobia bacterium]|jgi:O-methyltransferase
MSLCDRYLALLKAAVSNTLYYTPDAVPSLAEIARAGELMALVRARVGQSPWAEQRLKLSHERRQMLDRILLLTPEYTARWLQSNHPPCHTLLSGPALDNLRMCIETVLADEVAGDLIECGVYRGGAAIFMRGVLCAHGDQHRRVWVADSFEGLPEPGDEDLLDALTHELLKEVGAFRVSVESVQEAFRRYDLLDEQVAFLPGWFSDTLPSAPVERLSVLRLDADYYESTRVALDHLYPRVSDGGFIIIDDYNPQFGAHRAVDEYRTTQAIETPLVQARASHVHYWRKTAR